MYYVWVHGGHTVYSKHANIALACAFVQCAPMCHDEHVGMDHVAAAGWLPGVCDAHMMSTATDHNRIGHQGGEAHTALLCLGRGPL